MDRILSDAVRQGHCTNATTLSIDRGVIISGGRSGNGSIQIYPGKAEISYIVRGVQRQATYYFNKEAVVRAGDSVHICFADDRSTSLIAHGGASGGWAITEQVLTHLSIMAAVLMGLLAMHKILRRFGRSIFDGSNEFGRYRREQDEEGAGPVRYPD
jgi:hypothetical protein